MSRYAPHAEVYRDTSGRYRWRVVAANGKTLADSGQSYSRKQTCVDGLQAVTGSAEYVEVES